MNSRFTRGPTNQDELSAHFVDRLRRAMHDNGITAAELARKAGLSKAAISQLMSDKSARLPNSYSIYNLARALNRNVDYFLGSSVRLVGDRASLQVDFHEDALRNIARLCREVVLRPDGAGTVLIADTLPEFTKTEQTLAAELGASAAVTEHAAEMADLRATCQRNRIRGIVLCDSAILMQLIRGSGLYRALDEHARQAQIALMVEFFELRFPDLLCHVVSFRQHRLSAALLYDQVNIAAPIFGGLAQVANAAVYEQLHARAEMAARRGVPLRQFVDLIEGA